MRFAPKGFALLLLATTAAPAFAADEAAEARCTAFAQQAFGADVAILSAKHVGVTAAGTPQPGGPPLASPLPAHCRVEGIVNKRKGAGGKDYGIGFAIALPDEWNGRFLLQGGGGLNGSVGNPVGPVAAGTQPALARGLRSTGLSHDLA